MEPVMHLSQAICSPPEVVDLDEIGDLLLEVCRGNTPAMVPMPVQVPPKVSPSKKVRKSPDMIRRRRNYLERKRMCAQKDSLRSMRETVRELENRFEALCASVDASRRKRDGHPDDQEKKLKTPSSMYQLLELATSGGCFNARQPSFYALIREMHGLIHENTHLREILEQHAYSLFNVRSLIEEARLDKTINSRMEFHQFGKACFIPFTTDDIFAVIRKDLANYVANKPDFNDPAINKKLPFGWRGCGYNKTPTLFHFQLSKEWPGTPEHHCETIWKYHLNVAQGNPDNKHLFCEQNRIDVLQFVSQDIIIVRRRVMLEGWTSWSVFLMYQSRFEDAYIFGILPLPLWGNGNPDGMDDPLGQSLLHAQETMAIRPVHHLFEPVVKEDGEVRTRVYRWGSSFSGEALFMPLFQYSAMESIIRFERLVVFPVVNLVVSCEDDKEDDKEDEATGTTTLSESNRLERGL